MAASPRAAAARGPAATGRGGVPEESYPWPWPVYRWLEGTDALAAAIDDPVGLAGELAAFVTRCETSIRWGRRAPWDGEAAGWPRSTSRPERASTGSIAPGSSMGAPPSISGRPPSRCRGARRRCGSTGNILLRDGRLHAVIDWSASGEGDPAADLVVAWTFPPSARAAYRAAVCIDDDAWLRARAIGLSQAVRPIPYYELTIPHAVSVTRRRLAALMADD